MPWIMGGATLACGLLGAGSSKKAGGKAPDASNKAAELQMQMFQQTQANLAPFRTAGAEVLPALNALALSGPTGGGPDYITQAAGERPGQMTQAELEQTPGYQFTLGQGLKAVQSAAAARGLGVSGAALKGAATYATGLANTTYKDQFNLQQQRFKDLLDLSTGQQNQLSGQYTRLHDTAALGENAAANTGTQGTAAANAAGNYTNQAGQAQATAGMNASNALTNAGNSFLQYQNFQQLMDRFAPQGGGTQGLSQGLQTSPSLIASPNARFGE